MENKTDKVMPPGSKAKKLVVGGMHKPGQGVPIGSVKVGTSPGDGLPGQAFLNVRVCNVGGVVVVDEGMPHDRTVDDACKSQQ